MAFLAASVAFAAVRISAAPVAAPERWVEVRSPHFTVISNGSEKDTRQVAEQFEQFRAVIRTALQKIELDPALPVIILAAKNEKSLRELLPAYWETKGHMHPAGIFIAGPEKNYVALRLDVQGENPYQVIYHEYVHLLSTLNVGRLPLWLSEGIAEFYANTLILGKEVSLGRPSTDHLTLLNENRLLRLDVLFAVDSSSPYYNESNKTSIFYAQSWALTHYLMIGDKTARAKQLTDLLLFLQQGATESEAALRAFGDLKQFEKKLESYIRQASFYAFRMKAPADIDEKAFPVRALTPAEAAAARGDFHVHLRRPREARALLEEALQLDPTLAAPRESLGQLAMREGEHAQALQWFEQALRLDSKSFLAHYYHAQLTAQEGITPERMESIERDLRRAIELNANFAPACAVLAQLYASQGSKLEDALALATKATQLEPGRLEHHLVLAGVYLRMERFADAEGVARRVLAGAKTPAEQATATELLESVRRARDYLAEKRRFEEELRRGRQESPPREGGAQPSRGAGQTETTRSAAADSKAALRPDPAAAESAAAPNAAIVPGEGRIAALTCSGTALDLTLDYAGLTLDLHAENYFKIEYKTTRWQPPKNFDPCRHLKGREVNVEYKVVTGKPYAGELVSVEVRK